MLAAAIAHYNVNVWLGLVALVYAVAVRAWPPALVLLVGAVLVAIGGRGVVAWLSSGWRPMSISAMSRIGLCGRLSGGVHRSLSYVFVSASHVARCVACHGVRSTRCRSRLW